MKTIDPVRPALITALFVLVAWWPESRGWAQAVGGSTATGAAQTGGLKMAVVMGSVVVLLLILGVLVKIWDLKRKREGEAVIVQSQISDAVLREPALFSLPIIPTAHVPLWRGSPVTVEVAGQVPSDDLRQTALRVIEREASQRRSDVRIESRIGVAPTMTRRSA